MHYPATTLSFQKGKYYVVVTIPAELKEYFKGRKQLKRSTGTSDDGQINRFQFAHTNPSKRPVSSKFQH